MAFRDIYFFEVCETLADGAQVWVLDKQEHLIIDANETTAEHLMNIISDAKNDKSNRYAFWMEVANK